MRKECTRLVGKNLELKNVTVLVCPRCGGEEILAKKRQKRRFDLQALLYDSGTEKFFEWDDVCSSCMRAFLEWLQPTEKQLPGSQ